MEIIRSEYTVNDPKALDYKAAEEHIKSLNLSDGTAFPALLRYLQEYLHYHPKGFSGGKYSELRGAAGAGTLMHFHSQQRRFSLDHGFKERLEEIWETEDLDERIQELAIRDLNRLKGWLDNPSSFPEVPWEAFGYGAELKSVGGGYFILLEAEDTGSWIPTEQEMPQLGYQLHKGAHQTLKRLGTIGATQVLGI